MGDTNRVGVRLTKEQNFGEIPTNPVFTSLRVTGTPNLSYNPNTITSEEIRADRQLTDTILVGAEAGGDIGQELSFGAIDDLFEGALMANWSNNAVRTNKLNAAQITAVTTSDFTVTGTENFLPNMIIQTTGFDDTENNGVFVLESGTTSTDLNVTGTVADGTPSANAELRVVGYQGTSDDLETDVTGSVNQLRSTTTDFTTLGMSVGQWVKLGGDLAATKFDTPAVNGFCRVSVIEANAVTFDIVPTGFATDSGSGKTIRLWLADSITNASVSNSYTIEQSFNDHSPVDYQYFRGMQVNTFSMSLSSQSIVTTTATFLGQDALFQNRPSGVVDVDAPAGSVLNTSSNVAVFLVEDAPLVGANYALEATIDINNNLRGKPAIGVLGNVDVGLGEFNVSGTLNTYFDNTEIVTKLFSQDETSIMLSFYGNFQDGGNSSDAVLIDIPRIKYTGGAPDVPGKNQDVTANLPWQALAHPTLGYTMRIQRYWYIERS